MRNNPLIPVALIALLMGGCSTRYALVDESAFTEWAQEKNVGPLKYECWERIGSGQFHPWNSCPMLQEQTEAGDTGIVVEVRRTAYLHDVSPGMIFFMGVIPAENLYEYEISATIRRSGDSARVLSRKVHVLETWGSLNTVRNLSGQANKLEEIEMQIFRAIHEKLNGA